MPKPSRSTLIWSDGHQHYDLHSHGQPEQCFPLEDEAAFSCWLVEHSSFAFWGRAGRIFVLKEARRGGRGYWYAYHTQDRHTHKRYLGPSSNVTFVRLEEVAKALTSQPPLIPPFPPPPGSPREVLLGVKLAPPRLPGALVERSRLLRSLDAVSTHPLTLVSASAGSGKTTLLSDWVAASVRQEASLAAEAMAFAWLSLEDLDNDPIRFWEACIVALRTCLPRLGETPLAMLHAQEALPLSTCLICLLHEIEQSGKELVFLLDDYHVISDQTITESMRFLLDHLPTNLHLVLATRTDPKLPLSRLRVRGQLLEIRDSDLRFTQEEASCFLVEGMSLPLSEDEVTALQARTQGWIAGLQLAALSLKKREDLSVSLADFTGSHRLVLDYVQQDILAYLPDTLLHFLLQNSILTSMNAALCQAVTDLPSASECQELLETLERSNLFLVPLDVHRLWYRFHDLFREALRAQLQASQSEQVPLLHLRAARFYETAGQYRSAIAHALAAPDYAYAADLMERAAPRFWLSGEGRAVQNWVLLLPDAVLGAHTRLALSASLHVLYSIPVHVQSVVAEAGRLITRLQRLLQDSPELVPREAEIVLLERRLHLLRAFSEARAILMHSDPSRLLQLAQVSESLPADAEASWNLIPLSLTYWLTDFSPRSRASLISRLLIAKQQALQEAHHPSTIRIMSMLGEASIKNGQLRQARGQYLEVLALIEHSGVRTSLIGSLYLELFTISYAQNQLEEAAHWLHQGMRIAHDWRQAYLLAQGEIGSMRLALARGELEAAYEALQRLQALLSLEEFPQSVPREEYVLWKEVSRVEYWLASRDLTQAQAWAARHLFSPQTGDLMHNCELLALVQVVLAQQQYESAVELLSHFREALCELADIQTAIHFLTLSVVALCHAGRREEAFISATRLFALTEQENSIRVYLDAGKPMKQALKMLCEVPSSADPYVSRLLQLFEQEEQRSAFVPDEQPAGSPVASPPFSSLGMPLDPLTTQELKVLRLLAAGYSNQQIADVLVVSLNTVKSHVKHLYSKLAVNSRLQASTRGRELHLL